MSDLSVWEVKTIKWKKGGVGEESATYFAALNFDSVVAELAGLKKDPMVEVVSVQKIVVLNKIL